MRIAHEIVERNQGCDELYLVAIPNGGVPLGRLLVQNLDLFLGLNNPGLKLHYRALLLGFRPPDVLFCDLGVLDGLLESR